MERSRHDFDLGQVNMAKFYRISLINGYIKQLKRTVRKQVITYAKECGFYSYYLTVKFNQFIFYPKEESKNY